MLGRLLVLLPGLAFTGAFVYAIGALVHSSRVLGFERVEGTVTSAMVAQQAAGTRGRSTTSITADYEFVVAGTTYQGSSVLIDDAPIFNSAVLQRWKEQLVPGKPVRVYFSSADPADACLSQEVLDPRFILAAITFPLVALLLPLSGRMLWVMVGGARGGSADGALKRIVDALGIAGVLACLPSVGVFVLVSCGLPSGWGGRERTLLLWGCWAGLVLVLTPFVHAWGTRRLRRLQGAR